MVNIHEILPNHYIQRQDERLVVFELTDDYHIAQLSL